MDKVLRLSLRKNVFPTKLVARDSSRYFHQVCGPQTSSEAPPSTAPAVPLVSQWSTLGAVCLLSSYGGPDVVRHGDPRSQRGVGERIKIRKRAVRSYSEASISPRELPPLEEGGESTPPKAQKGLSNVDATRPSRGEAWEYDCSRGDYHGGRSCCDAGPELGMSAKNMWTTCLMGNVCGEWSGLECRLDRWKLARL